MATQDNQWQAELTLLRESGLFLPAFVLARNSALAASNLDPLEYFYRQGWRNGDWPNPYFDPAFYLAANQDVANAGINPLLHYAAHGDREGRDPCAFFDVKWYRARYGVPLAQNTLAHYLDRRATGEVAPVPLFDPVFYLEQNPDVATNGGDPFEHFLAFGAPELRDPCEQFDIKFYTARYGAALAGENPLLHYLRHRESGKFVPSRPEHEKLIPGAVRTATRASPFFEEFRAVPATAPRRAKLLAFYLPQFHRIPENDAWWGKGFTDWTNLLRAVPRFAGHLQPRAPRDLGFYNLADPATLRRQIDMALGAGLHGFIFYYYWFNKKRLLEGPLNLFLADQSYEMPFCIMWANENFTRRWDGLEREILLQQEYLPQHDPSLIEDFCRHFADARYIRVGARPLLIIYRPSLIPDAAHRIAAWRQLFLNHNENPLLIMAQSIGDHDPTPYGLDGAIEFPPHKLTDELPKINDRLDLFDPEFAAAVYDYEAVAAASLAAKPTDFPLIKTLTPGWDNEPRREGKGLVLHAATPDKYQAWLENLVDYAKENPFHGESFIAINAWNEWAEGAVLEPDIHFGAAFLNATARAVCGQTTTGKILVLAGHDAHPHGAQFLLLNLAKHYAQVWGFEVQLLLLGAGRLLPEYEKYSTVTLTNDKAAIANFIKRMAALGATAAIVNSAASARLVPQLSAARIRTTLLIHEMPKLLAEHNLQIQAKLGAQGASTVVFAAPFVRDSFSTALDISLPNAVILPQGNYQNITYDPAARAQLRESLNIKNEEFLLLAIGFGDLRKGFDLFIQIAAKLLTAHTDIHIAWLGEIQPTLKTYLATEIAVCGPRLHLAGFTDTVAAWLSAADIFLLPSREDPYPTVALEAIAAGLPVIAFDESGGIPALIRAHNAGAVAKPAGTEDFAAKAAHFLNHEKLTADRPRLTALAQQFDQPAYAARVIETAHPTLPLITAAILNYNYAHFLRERLPAIFNQTTPIREIVFLDDASTDESLELAPLIAAQSNRAIRIIANAKNSGSVFAQWRRAAHAAQGDFIWLAEADDSAAPDFLARLAEPMLADPSIVMAFADSQVIDETGKMLAPDYQIEYREAGADFSTSQTWPGLAFAQRYLATQNLLLNVSSILWRRPALLAAIEACGPELDQWRLAGDWRLYLEILNRAHVKIALIAAPLNRHRRHAASATTATNATQHLDEIARMQAIAAKTLKLDAPARQRQREYLRRIKAELVEENRPK